MNTHNEGNGIMAEQEQEPQMDYRLDVLRAAGHEAAAELLSKLPTPAPQPAAEVEAEAEQEPAAPEQEAPQRTMTPAEAYEAQQHAEGRALFDAMQRQLGRQWATSPTTQDGPNR